MNLIVRPQALEKPSAPARETQLLDAAALGQRAASWDRLSTQAAYPNPFHSRQALLAHETCGILDPRLRFLVVNGEGELRAVLPFIPNGGRTGLRRSHRVWLPPHFAVNGTPLVARGALPKAVDSLLDGMAAAGPIWRFPLLSVESPVGRALIAACERRRFPVGVVTSFDRAVLHRRGSYPDYVRSRLRESRRKGLRRLLRRLEEQGRVAFTSFTEGKELEDAVENFLVLEGAGWKGRRGTALAGRQPGACLTRALFARSPGVVPSRADVLTLNDRPIAISLALLCGGTAFLLKTAYDERFRRFAPGLLLEDAILREFLDGGFAEKLDSASLPGCVLEDLFVERERMADVVIATRSDFSARVLQVLVRQERVLRSVITTLKRFYWRVIDRASTARDG